jgi:predicted neutral ceramidase superfamily lipid hydrolase
LKVVDEQNIIDKPGGIDEYREEILEKISRREAEAIRVLQEKQAKRVQERESKIKELEEKRKQKLAAAGTSQVS